MRLPLKALHSVLKVRWYSGTEAQVSLRTDSRRQLVLYFRDRHVLDVAALIYLPASAANSCSASAGAGGRCGGTLMAVRGQQCHRGQRAH